MTRHLTARLPAAAARTLLREHLDGWTQLRAACPEAEIDHVDAEAAARLGLPTLAAIHRALAELTTTPTPREAAALLREVRRVALGEAILRVRRLLDRPHPDLPGVGALPQTMLESQYGPHGRGRPPVSRRGGAGMGKGRRRRGST